MYCFLHHNENLKRNNPEGFNRFKKSPEAKIKPLTQEEVFKSKAKDIQYVEICTLGNKVWRDGKELSKLKKQLTMMKNVYFGWKFEEET